MENDPQPDFEAAFYNGKCHDIIIDLVTMIYLQVQNYILVGQIISNVFVIMV